MKEKIVIIFVALILGLFITTTVFYIYQSAKNSETKNEKSEKATATKTPIPTNVSEKIFLSIDQPQDESIADKRTIQIEGKTNPENTIIVSSNLEDVTEKTEADGKFSALIQIDAGANVLTTRVISPSGEELIDIRTITFTQEQF